MHPLSQALRHLGLAFGLLLIAPASFALDVVESPPDLEILDKQLSIGGRTLALPDGHWLYANRTQWNAVLRTPPPLSIFAAYAMDVQNGRMQSAIVLELPVRSGNAPDWRADGCSQPGQLFRDDFGSESKTPECLQVYRRPGHLVGQQTVFYSDVQQWVQARGIKLPGPVYEVVYAKYSRNDYGRVRVFVPMKAVANDEEIVAWAQKLPATLAAFMDKRDKQAKLPSIPALPIEASAPVAPVATRPSYPATGFAALDDVARVPVNNDGGREMYREFLTRPMPRAFVISNETVLYTVGRNPPDLREPGEPTERALERCRKVSQSPCMLYAVDERVVWIANPQANPPAKAAP
nr:hypothetical protein [uncultured Albidiferax sp.]